MGSGWSNDDDDRIVLPSGATTGARVEIDGTATNIVIYDAANNVIGTLGPTGLTISDVDGSQVHIYDQSTGDGAVVDMLPANIPGHVNTPGGLRTDLSGISGLPLMVVSAPQYDGKLTAKMVLYSGDWIAGVGTESRLELSAGDIVVNDGFTSDRDIGLQDIGHGILGGAGVTTVGLNEIALTAASWNTAPGQEPSASFKPGRVAKVSIEINQFLSAVATTVGYLRLRRGSETIVGTLLHEWEYELHTNAGAVCRQWTCYVKNTTANTITTALSVSVIKVAGAPNITIGGPCTVLIEDVGSIANNPSRAAMAAAL